MSSPKKSDTKTRKKIKRVVEQAVAHISASFNNIKITISDLSGDTLAWSSAGANGFKGARKGTPFAGQTAAEAVVRLMEPFSIKELDVRVKGPGAGRDSAIRALSGVAKIKKIVDITSIPHNGCRPRKKRRS